MELLLTPACKGTFGDATQLNIIIAEPIWKKVRWDSKQVAHPVPVQKEENDISV